MDIRGFGLGIVLSFAAMGNTKNVELFQVDGNVDYSWVEKANTEVADTLPNDMIQYICNCGWCFYVTEKDLDDTYFNGQYGAVKGATLYDSHLIFIEDRENAIYDAVIHEIGHLYDYEHGFLSDSSEFMSIYTAESDIFKQAFNYTSYYAPEEMFAEGFWKYYDEEDKLKNNCPQLYGFLEKYLEA